MARKSKRASAKKAKPGYEEYVDLAGFQLLCWAESLLQVASLKKAGMDAIAEGYALGAKVHLDQAQGYALKAARMKHRSVGEGKE